MRGLVLAIVLAASTAHGQSFEITPERAGATRQLRVTAHGLGGAATKHTVLTWDGGFAEPTSRQMYIAGREPLAIVIVMSSQEIFLGNDDFETDSAATYLGILKWFESGIDELHLEKRVPAGSTIEVVNYWTGAKVRVPMKPIAAFHGADLGTQVEYRGTIGSDMIEGIELGAHELDQSTAPVKLLFVLGDGNDTNNQRGEPRLDELATLLRAHQIEVAGAVYKSPVSSDKDIIETLIPNVARISTGDAAEELSRAIERVIDRTSLTFADEALPWDGDQHAFTLTVGDAKLPPVTITMPGGATSHVRWYQVLFGIALVALIGGFVAKRRTLHAG